MTLPSPKTKASRMTDLDLLDPKAEDVVEPVKRWRTTRETLCERYAKKEAGA